MMRVAVLTPEIKYWVPTHESALVERVERFRELPENVVIRHSGAMIDGPIPPGERHVFSAIHTKAPQAGALSCTAPSQNGECRDCRACWSKEVHCVSYHKH